MVVVNFCVDYRWCLGGSIYVLSVYSEGRRLMPKKIKKLPKKVTKASLKAEYKSLEDLCDKYWSLCVRERDKTCRVSNSDKHLTAHHIRSKQHNSTRWMLDNGLTLSWKVHFLQKANPEKFQDMVVEVVGDEEYARLKSMSLVVTKYNMEDLKDRLEELKAEYKRLKHE